jgi:ubiquinone/menaquinone biosynthesis C-methylase UbiE
MYNEKWLDVGCGTGEWVSEMAESNPDKLLLGMDKDRTLCAEWKKGKPTNVEYIVADARYLPFKTNSLDHVYARILGPFDTEGICHLANETQRVLMYGTMSFSVSLGVLLGEPKK